MQRRWRGMRVAFLSGKHGEDVRAAAGPVCTVDGRVASMRQCAGFANFSALMGTTVALINTLLLIALDRGQIVLLALEAVNGRAVLGATTGRRADGAGCTGGGARARRVRRGDGTAGRWCARLCAPTAALRSRPTAIQRQRRVLRAAVFPNVHRRAAADAARPRAHTAGALPRQRARKNAPGGHRTRRPVNAHAALITPHADGRRDSVRSSGVARHSAAVQPRRTAHLRGQTGGLPHAQATRRPSAAQLLRGAQAQGGASQGRRSVHLRARGRGAGLSGAARRVRVRVGGHHRRGGHRDGAGHAAHEARRGALCTVRDGARARGAREVQLTNVDAHTTYVVYMGLSQLPSIAEQMMSGGLCATTPSVAVAPRAPPRDAQPGAGVCGRRGAAVEGVERGAGARPAAAARGRGAAARAGGSQPYGVAAAFTRAWVCEIFSRCASSAALDTGQRLQRQKSASGAVAFGLEFQPRRRS
ncbi:Tetrapyrrole methylase [Gracilaria domingensis]|nr:Tetrapyrrole methylase [Gracilaria domingensis]